MMQFSASRLVQITVTASMLGWSALAQNTESKAVSSEVTATTATTKSTPQPEGEEAALDPASLLPDLPKLPKRKASLIGGSVLRVDRIRDELTIRIFGGGKMKILYDPRTQMQIGSGAASPTDLKIGDRVYVDTILDGSKVFARNIRVGGASEGNSQGVVVSYRPERNELEVRDQLSPGPVKMRLDTRTEIERDGKAAPASDLIPGTLVNVVFITQKNGRDAQQVKILAVPGSSFTFAGQVVSLDLHLGLLVIESSNDHKTYEVSLDPSITNFDENLRAGADVTAVTNFDGTKYIAQRVVVNSQ